MSNAAGDPTLETLADGTAYGGHVDVAVQLLARIVRDQLLACGSASRDPGLAERLRGIGAPEIARLVDERTPRTFGLRRKHEPESCDPVGIGIGGFHPSFLPPAVVESYVAQRERAEAAERDLAIVRRERDQWESESEENSARMAELATLLRTAERERDDGVARWQEKCGRARVARDAARKALKEIVDCEAMTNASLVRKIQAIAQQALDGDS